MLSDLATGLPASSVFGNSAGIIIGGKACFVYNCLADLVRKALVKERLFLPYLARIWPAPVVMFGPIASGADKVSFGPFLLRKYGPDGEKHSPDPRGGSLESYYLTGGQ